MIMKVRNQPCAPKWEQEERKILQRGLDKNAFCIIFRKADKVTMTHQESYCHIEGSVIDKETKIQ
jgi:hypothetical protein